MSVRRRGSRAALVLLVLSALAAVRPSVAQAAEPVAASGRTNEAAEHFRRGVTLYKDGDYEAALIEFRRAQDLSPNFRILYDIGQASYQLQRYADALNAFESYLAQGGAQVPHPRQSAVEADLKVLHTRVGRVDVSVSADGAEVRVDEQVVGTSPLSGPVLVSIGHRKVTVTKAGFPALEKFVDVAAGDRTRIVFDFPTPEAPPPVVVQIPTPAPPPETRAGAPASPHPLPPPVPPSSSGALVWVPWTVTGLLAAGTAVTGVLALNAKTTLDNELDTYSAGSNGIEQARSRARAYAIASDACLGGAAVALGVALYVTIAHGTGHRERTDANVKVGLGLGGIQLREDF